MSALLDEAKQVLTGQLMALDEDREQLQRAIAELDGGTKPVRRGRPKGKGRGKAKRTRKPRGGTRAEEAVALITKEPGITASDIAKAMKIKPNYLYRVLGDLEKEKRVKKAGRKYFPVG